MLSSVSIVLSALSLTASLSLPNEHNHQRRQAPGMQAIPNTARPDNTFSNGVPMDNKGAASVQAGEDPGPLDPIYGPRDIDLPFYRLYHGNMKFFSTGQLNTPDLPSDDWSAPIPGGPSELGRDSAKQSACGIPNNAFFDSHVAIHPYFLKYAGLDRYCMQDVCISFWNQAGVDMIAKVTDICSTDPSDPSHCATPADIKLSKAKAFVLYGFAAQADQDHTTTIANTPQLQGTEYPEKIYWFFTKCWADGTVQSAYKNNWFAQPPLVNNKTGNLGVAFQQMLNNQQSYPAKGWAPYPNGGYNPERDAITSPPIPDWVPGQPDPAWTPLAGGKGYSGKF